MSDPTQRLMDDAALRTWLQERLPVGPGAAYKVERHQAGHSNETFFVTWGRTEMVLRRPPAGAFLPTAHDVLREYRILCALDGSDVRAPRPILACEDASVIGAPFYLMEKARGVVLREALPPGIADVARIGDELIDALAEVHGFPWQKAGIEGKPEGYLERQVKRWTGQMEMTLPWTSNVREVPELVEAGGWLAANVPRSPKTTLVHGDYKLDNVLFSFGPAGPNLAAILDWEMSTLGDPLADVGWMLSFWREQGDPAPDISVTPRITEAPGMRTRAELIARYEAKTGTKVENLRFYEALAVWKLAILLEGSYARHLLGATDDPFFAQMEKAVPALARRALRTARA
ncbi:MAG TPA: phosphotransferase family protein [Candidatus Thermoplasmatota archaeon]|nr:phosphotransferase family protein [Candidatus Thermoplasmatota archaeon]